MSNLARQAEVFNKLHLKAKNIKSDIITQGAMCRKRLQDKAYELKIKDAFNKLGINN